MQTDVNFARRRLRAAVWFCDLGTGLTGPVDLLVPPGSFPLPGTGALLFVSKAQKAREERPLRPQLDTTPAPASTAVL